MRPTKEDKPYANPMPIRFTVKQLAEIEEVAESLDMSKQEVVRLACSAGLAALRKLGADGLKKAVSRLLTEE